MDSVRRAVVSLYGTGAEIVERRFFRCKKNQVTRLTIRHGNDLDMIVAKYYVWGSAPREEKILRLCHSGGIAAPEVLLRTGRVTLMEHIDGATPSLTTLQNQEHLSSLVRWLASFHQTFRRKKITRLKGDMRLHNFILRGSDIYGIDFEETSWGAADVDVADICVSLLETGKGFQEENLDIVRHFLEEYSSLQPLTGRLSSLIVEKLMERSEYRSELQKVYYYWASMIKEMGIGSFWTHIFESADDDDRDGSAEASIFQNFSKN